MAEQVLQGLLLPALREVHGLYSLYNGYLPPSIRPYTSQILGATFVVGNIALQAAFSGKRRRSRESTEAVNPEDQPKLKKAKTTQPSSACQEAGSKPRPVGEKTKSDATEPAPQTQKSELPETKATEESAAAAQDKDITEEEVHREQTSSPNQAKSQTELPADEGPKTPSKSMPPLSISLENKFHELLKTRPCSVLELEKSHPKPSPWRRTYEKKQVVDLGSIADSAQKEAQEKSPSAQMIRTNVSEEEKNDSVVDATAKNGENESRAADEKEAVVTPVTTEDVEEKESKTVKSVSEVPCLETNPRHSGFRGEEEEVASTVTVDSEMTDSESGEHLSSDMEGDGSSAASFKSFEQGGRSISFSSAPYEESKEKDTVCHDVEEIEEASSPEVIDVTSETASVEGESKSDEVRLAWESHSGDVKQSYSQNLQKLQENQTHVLAQGSRVQRPLTPLTSSFNLRSFYPMSSGTDSTRSDDKSGSDLEQQATELANFYKILGRKNADVSNARQLILEYGSIGKLSKALMMKYRCVPHGWSDYISTEQDSGVTTGMGTDNGSYRSYDFERNIEDCTSVFGTDKST